MSQRIGLTILAGLGAILATAQTQVQSEQQVAVWRRARTTAVVRSHTDKTRPAQPTHIAAAKPAEGSEAEAVLWERAKDRAAERQVAHDAAEKPKK